MGGLTHQNYHSVEMNRKYMGVSQFKGFLPRYGGCEALAVHKLTEEWVEKPKDAFLLGGYVHAWNSGDLQDYMADNPELFKRDGTLYAKFAVADDIINTLREDPLIAKVREGEKEVIMTGELFDMPWKIMLDIYTPMLKAFTDLKTCREIGQTFWNDKLRERINFILHWGYDWQMAAYAEIERQFRGGKDYFQPHIIAVSKEDPPDKEIIHFGTEFIPQALAEMELYAPRIKGLWRGEIEPIGCGKCGYCRAKKRLTGTVYYLDI